MIVAQSQVRRPGGRQGQSLQQDRQGCEGQGLGGRGERVVQRERDRTKQRRAERAEGEEARDGEDGVAQKVVQVAGIHEAGQQTQRGPERIAAKRSRGWKGIGERGRGCTGGGTW